MTKTKNLIALVGGPGSGKTTVANYLEGKGYIYFSISEVRRIVGLSHEIDPDNFESMRTFTEMFYSIHGKGIFVEYLIQNIAERENKSIVIEGLRHVESIDVARCLSSKNTWNIKCMGLKTDPVLAAKRITLRGRKRDPQGSNSILDYAVSANAKALEAINHCDITISNNRTIEELLSEVDKKVV